MRRFRLSALSALIALVALGPALVAARARADSWLPHPAGATWQYRWTDSIYNPSGTVENVVVQQSVGPSFTLAWADTSDQPPSASAATGLICPSGADLGTVTFEETNGGLLNTDWNSCPPPPTMPVLCPTTSCANSLAGALYSVIWGTRAPVLSEPLLRGASWNATGGAQSDVASTSQDLGLQFVRVPAFPGGVLAAAVRTNIVQPATLGAPYGSGVRTTWWVYGVGPVRVSFQHAGADGAVTEVDLLNTNLKPLPAPPDADYFPLTLGLNGTYRWSNRRHLPSPEVDSVKVAAVAGRAAQIDVRSHSGPIRATGTYDFTSDLNGIVSTAATASAKTLLRLPRLSHGRHFFTVVDLMTFGFNPLLPAYPATGAVWHSGNARDLQAYGVRGTTRILGVQTVHVPAGTFSALAVRSVLAQRGSRYGSGVRTMWFAPGRGLVKLVFAHRDHSVSVVQLIR